MADGMIPTPGPAPAGGGTGRPGRAVDLNADLGESFGAWRLGDDEALLDVVTSANVACGFHAGDPLTVWRTVRAAADRGVVVGAQVSYRDLAGFGRRFIDYEPDELMADVLYQVAALDGLCRSAGIRVRYLKPHGALYHAVSTSPAQAQAVIAAIRTYDPELPVLGAAGSAFLVAAAAAGLPTRREAFADRAYAADGTLVSRRQPGAVLHDPELVAARTVHLVTTGTVTAVDGTEVALEADSVCLHGDSPGAVALARAVRARLADAGVAVRPFLP